MSANPITPPKPEWARLVGDSLKQNGVWHTYANPSNARAKYLLFMSPGGFEKYLEQLAEMIRTEPTWPPADKSKLDALAEKYDATPG